VYKLSKAFYMLKQASRAWYARLKTFLQDHGYVMGSTDNTLFTLKYGNNFLLVQICVDDIIFDHSSHVPDVHDGRINLFHRYQNQANEAGHTSSQVQEGHHDEIQHGLA
jgi:hypothetical protein